MLLLIFRIKKQIFKIDIMGKNQKINILKIFDIFRVPILLRYKKRQHFSSNGTIILSFIVYFLSIIYCIFSLKDLISHKSYSFIINTKTEIKNIDLSKTPIMLGLVTNEGNSIPLNSSINISSYQKIFEKEINEEGKEISIVKYNNIEMEFCNYSKYANTYSEMRKYNLSNYLCIKSNQNITLNGRHRDFLYGFSTINFYLKLYNNNKLFLENYYYSLVYLSDIIDNDIYENPIIKQFRTENFQITLNAYKKFFYSFSPIIYKSHNGLFFNYIHKYKSFEFNDIQLDFVNNDDDEYLSDKEYISLIKIIFTSTEYYNEIIRKYLNFYHFCSNIGGTFEILFGFFNFLAIYFSRKSIVVDLVNELVPSENRISNKSKQFINLKNRHLFSNNRDNVKIYKKFKTELKKKNTIKITDDKSQIEKLNKTKIPYRNINFIFEDSLEKQRFKISFVNYLLPFFYLRKKKKYQLLCKYSDYIDSYLSIEEMLPIIILKKKKIMKILITIIFLIWGAIKIISIFY